MPSATLVARERNSRRSGSDDGDALCIATLEQGDGYAQPPRSSMHHIIGCGAMLAAFGSIGPRIFLVTADSPKVQIIDVTM